jgi:hypothetical protein
VSIIGAKLGATAPTLATLVDDIQQYTFDDSDDFVIGATEITHKWKEGSVLYPHIHWAVNGLDGTDRGVKWQLKYTIADGLTAFPVHQIVSADLTITAGTADRMYLRNDLEPAISGVGLKVGTYIVWRLERVATAHANGGPAADPFAIAVGFHIEMDTIGSRAKRAK